jgi:hypothetical protein
VGPDGRVWFQNIGRLYSFDGETLTLFTGMDQIAGDMAFSFAVDGDGGVWLPGYDAVYRFRPGD